MKNKLLITSIFIGALAFTGCSEKENNDKKISMTIPIKVDFNSIAPDKDISAATEEVIRNMNATLIRFDPDSKSLVPGLAKSYTVSDDGTSYTFQLRDNLKFHNDKVITPEDVKFSFERLAGLNGAPPIMGDWAKILEKVEITNDNKIIVHIKNNEKSSSDIYKIADVSIIPAGSNEKDLEKHPIGAGAYKFVEYLPGQKLVLESFDNYYLGKPEVEKVEFRVYKEGAGRVLSFKNKEIDFLPLTPETTKEIKKMEGIEVVSSLGNDVNVFYLNHNYEPFKNKNVRQAIWQSIDMDRVINNLSLNGAQKLSSHMSPYLKEFYNSNLQNKYPYNPEYAKKLLKESGYENLSFTLNTISENNFENDMALLIKEDLQQVGINMNINPIPWGQYLPKVYKNRDYEAAILRIAGYPDPQRILQRYKSDFSSNMGNYSNPRVDELLILAKNTYNKEQLQDIYKEIQLNLTNDISAVYLLDQGVSIALSPKFTGYKIYPFAFIDVSSIKVKKEK